MAVLVGAWVEVWPDVMTHKPYRWHAVHKSQLCKPGLSEVAGWPAGLKPGGHLCWLESNTNTLLLCDAGLTNTNQIKILYFLVHICMEFPLVCEVEILGHPTSLKRKCCHFDEILITDCTESCHFDNFRCSQWWKFRQNDDILFEWWQVRMLGTKYKYFVALWWRSYGYFICWGTCPCFVFW